MMFVEVDFCGCIPGCNTLKISGLHITKVIPNLVQWVIGYGDLIVKNKVHAWLNRYVCPNWLLSNPLVLQTVQGLELDRCK
eukprot:1157028-Pelagomonas_calceolata.AAC.1